MSLLHHGEGRTIEDLESEEPPPPSNQGLESNWIFQERV